MIIYLIGFMGSGKSHTGRRLAEARGVPFVDLDDWIEVHSGLSIAQIFNAEGEKGFRKREQKALHQTVSLERAVVACGGGTPCFFDNMEWMNARGLTVFLDTPAALILERLRKEREHRPLIRDLNEAELGQYIRNKLAERRPCYEQAKVIYTQREAAENVAGRLARQFIHITGH